MRWFYTGRGAPGADAAGPASSSRAGADRPARSRPLPATSLRTVQLGNTRPGLRPGPTSSESMPADAPLALGTGSARRQHRIGARSRPAPPERSSGSRCNSNQQLPRVAEVAIAPRAGAPRARGGPDDPHADRARRRLRPARADGAILWGRGTTRHIPKGSGSRRASLHGPPSRRRGCPGRSFGDVEPHATY